MQITKITNATGELEKVSKINELIDNVAIVYGATTQCFEFIINTAESDPTAAVSYTGMNKNYTPASMNFTTGKIDYGSWKGAFFQPRPVMVKYDGTVDYELNPNDFTKKLDGTASDVANTSYGGNCMIAFPQVWMKFVQDDSTHQHIYIADRQVDNSFHCYTHQNKNGDWLNEIFLMAYEPCVISNKLRSLAGQTVAYNGKGTTYQTYAQANGASWDFMDYGEIQMLQMLCILMFKSLDSQTKIGAGYVNGGGNYETTGTTKDKGMFYAICNETDYWENGHLTRTKPSYPIKVFGIENLWGNKEKWINGLVATYSDSTGYVKYKLCDYTTDGTTETAYTETGTGYKTLTTYTVTGGAFIHGSINKMVLNSDGLFPSPDYVSGTGSTYFCDEGSFDVGQKFALYGGHNSSASNAGVFKIYLMVWLGFQYDNYYAPTLSCKHITQAGS